MKCPECKSDHINKNGMPPLLRGDPPAYRHPPYQGGQGGSNLKSIFNLIITSYLDELGRCQIERCSESAWN